LQSGAGAQISLTLVGPVHQICIDVDVHSFKYNMQRAFQLTKGSYLPMCMPARWIGIAELHFKQHPNRAANQSIQSRYLGGMDYLVTPGGKFINEAKEKEKQKNSKSARPSYRFTDRSRVLVRGGRGGKGSLSTHVITRKNRLRPDGGHGGAGGSVILIADPNEQTLTRSHPHLAADNGTNGTSQDCHGAAGKNRIIRVPTGVVVKRILEHDDVWDEETRTVRKLTDEVDDSKYVMGPDGEPEFDMRDEINAGFQGFGGDDEDYDYDDDEAPKPERQIVTLADLDEPGAYLVVAIGGRGGLGTSFYASQHRPLPDARYLTKVAKPDEGEVVLLELELKLIADIGLVGFPNAGKSSLLRAMSAASPEVAPYPFTTLHPLIGVIEYRDGFRVKAADIPGLIDGASDGRGKGHDFLKHVERTKALLYIVDVAGVDLRDPISDLRILAKELRSYGDGSLMERRALLVANKVDLLHEDHTAELLVTLRETATELGIRFEHDVIPISAGVTGVGLGVLSKAIRDIVVKSESDRQEEFDNQIKVAS
jgi:GTPase